MELFGKEQSEEGIPKAAPLALRMRPRTVEEFVGQSHFFAEGQLLRRLLKADRLSSLIFYGPPGTGKTALAHVIANTTRAHWREVNATTSNVKELREIISLAERQGGRTVVFVDELHRFNRAQQDVLLPHVERGTIILIGATTMNPFFAINSPLLSRSNIFEFRPHSPEEIKVMLRAALSDGERGLGRISVEATEEALDHLSRISEGDARRALNALEVGVLSALVGTDGVIHYDLAAAEESIQRKAVVYDRDEDQHYDTASAFTKSMRGGDPDAALYWMAKMLEAGEDPRFVIRRVVICAAEDVGNAAPMALVLATAALHAVEFVGMPEARIPMAQAVTYIACAPKSNAAYVAIDKAMQDIREGRTLPVPEHLRDASYRGAEKLGHGIGYKYAHSYEGHWVDQDYLPAPRVYYEPTEEGAEKQIKERLEQWKRRKQEGKSGKP
jgi:putative ATPase